MYQTPTDTGVRMRCCAVLADVYAMLLQTSVIHSMLTSCEVQMGFGEAST